MRELLQITYDDQDVDILLEGIERLKQKYGTRLNASKEQLSHEDVVLIVYGDQLTDADEKPLSTLHHFLNDRVKGVINGVHILPFYPYTSDDGFSVTDYYEVNHELGAWDDIKKLSEDYKLMFDAVINHMSKSSNWFQAFLSGEDEFQDYFIEVDATRDWSSVVRPRTTPLFHSFEDTKGNIKSIWTTFSEDQVDINYDNPRVFLHILDVLLYYISKGARMLRLDAIGFMIKEEKTKSIHLPQTHAVIKVMRKVIETLDSGVVLITETNVPHAENISYFGNGGDEAHMVYNFTLPPLLAYSILKGDSKTLNQWAQSLSLPSDKVCFFNFTASHDGVGLRPLDGILPVEELQVLLESAEANEGLISYRTGPGGGKSPYEINCNFMSLLFGKEQDPALGVKRMILTQAIKLAMPGVPAIYFHSLVGSLNFTDGVRQTGVNRTINREKLNLGELNNELDDTSSIRYQVYHRLYKLLEVRKKQIAFHPFGNFHFPEFGNELFGIQRQYNDQKLLCIFNFQNDEISVNLPTGQFFDLLNDQYVAEELKLGAYGFTWLEHQ
ncbi:MAG: alpha-amylase family glycosyl hydrolase [Bacteroidota bacterium]